MTFDEACAIAAKYGAKLPAHETPATQCWIDRVAYIPVAAELDGAVPYRTCEAVAEANRYAGP